MKIKIETRKDLIVGDITINMHELESWLEMLQQGNADAVQDEEMIQTVVGLFEELEWHANKDAKELDYRRPKSPLKSRS